MNHSIIFALATLLLLAVLSGCDFRGDNECEGLQGAIKVVATPDTLRYPFTGEIHYLTVSQYFEVREGLPVVYVDHRWSTDAIVTQAIRQDTIWFLASRPVETSILTGPSYGGCMGGLSRGVRVPVVVE